MKNRNILCYNCFNTRYKFHTDICLDPEKLSVIRTNVCAGWESYSRPATSKQISLATVPKNTKIDTDKIDTLMQSSIDQLLKQAIVFLSTY